MLNIFYDCSGLTSVTIGNSVTSIEKETFYGCNNLLTVVTLIEKPFVIIGKDGTQYDKFCCTFSRNTFMNATLYVPVGTIGKYRATSGWKDFVFMEEGTGGGTPIIPESKQCEKPTISYKDGKLIFSSKTEGATCQYSIADSDIKSGSGNEVELTVTYNISVYASKTGCYNSETATATLCWIDQQPRMEGVVNGVAEVKVRAFLIKNDGGNIVVEGADDGEQVGVYTINGIQVGSAVSRDGTAVVNTALQNGEIAIVKVGGKSVKVMIK